MAFESNLPQAAGLSSSSALVVATYLALEALGELSRRSKHRQALSRCTELAAYLGAVESGRAFGPFVDEQGVGTEGGSGDHTAILCSAPGQLRLFAYRPARLEQTIPCPRGYQLVIASSGVVAEKAGAARERYNRASRLAAQGAARWSEATGQGVPHLGALLADAGGDRARVRAVLHEAGEAPADLVARFDHFCIEADLIGPAAAALAAGDLGAFGAYVDRSQRGAEELLGNQVPETAFLARAARELGAAAASAFGAGFGGAVWALVEETQTRALCEAWATRYQAAFPKAAQRAAFFVDRPGPSAFRLQKEA